ncbi:MAG TPA: iron-sulfur cluster assembly scaffold protein [Turneriella sp.]|nr:iron-sulfur cluster assembly scaffold protein [Turneriella sp.]
MPAYSSALLSLAETPQVLIRAGNETCTLRNPLCGDCITLALEEKKGRVENIEWQAEGCAILKASAALLAQTLRQKTKDEAKDLLLQFEASFEHENSFHQSPLAAVYALPARYKCALLPWYAVKKLLGES